MKIRLSTARLWNFFEEKHPKVVDGMTWVLFRLTLLWNSKERAEYRQFFKIKRLSTVANTPEMMRLFKEKVLVLCNTISDDMLVQHTKRLNNGEGVERQPYFLTSGNEKACIKAHEVIEMLSMKWEKGIPLYKDRGLSVFWPAHHQAIRVENIFLQALGLEKKLPLSKAALEYCRICDDDFLTHPIRFSADLDPCLDLETTEKNLTKNFEAMPSHPNEIDCYCKFFSQSQFTYQWSPRVRIGLCQRYIFSKLSREYPDKKLYLITLLRALEKDDIYNTHSLEIILSKLQCHLQSFGLPPYWYENSIRKKYHFFVKHAHEIPFEIREYYNKLKDSFTVCS